MCIKEEKGYIRIKNKSKMTQGSKNDTKVQKLLE